MTLVDQLRDRFGVEPVLRVLAVASSTFYGWLAQAAAPCQHRREDAELLTEIGEIHDASGGTYGSPRVHATLRRRARRVGRKRVERLMRAGGWQGSFPASAGGSPPPGRNPNARPAPDRLWVTDATRIPVAEGCSGRPRV